MKEFLPRALIFFINVLDRVAINNLSSIDDERIFGMKKINGIIARNIFIPYHNKESKYYKFIPVHVVFNFNYDVRQKKFSCHRSSYWFRYIRYIYLGAASTQNVTLILSLVDVNNVEVIVTNVIYTYLYEKTR